MSDRQTDRQTDGHTDARIVRRSDREKEQCSLESENFIPLTIIAVNEVMTIYEFPKPWLFVVRETEHSLKLEIVIVSLTVVNLHQLLNLEFCRAIFYWL